MGTRSLSILIVVLAAVIIILFALLLLIPAPRSANPGTTGVASSTQTVASSTTAATSSVPLDQSVVVTAPAMNATVGHTFTITGEAPGPWFFEAVFPIKVFDSNDNTVGVAQGHAQGDWMTTSLVTFTATMTVDSNFHGPATLILIKDNPSGLPQNDDSVEVPIVVQ